MKKRAFKRQLNNAGFTLVEMITVLVIMVILLSLTVGGIMAWQDWSKMKQLNSHAENIFMAAQTQLSEYYSGGALEHEVQAAVDKSTKVITFTKDGSGGTMNISLITDPEGNAYSWNEVWSSGDSEHYQGTIVSVSSEPGDYSKFLKNEDLDAGTALLFKLVTAYISDKSILNDSSIILEFSPDAAQVLAVCYSKDSALSYDDEADAVCVRDRSEAVRNELALGYYGVDTLSMPLKGKTDNTLILEAGAFELRNEEILDALYVPLNDQEVFGAGAAHTFQLNIYDPELENQNKLMSLEFDVIGGNSLPYSMAEAQGSKATQMKATYYEDGTALPAPDGEDAPVFRVPVWIEYTAMGDRAIRIALDAADIRAQSLLYERALKLTDSSLEDSKAQDAADAFKETYSFYRFGLDADYIYLGIKIKEKDDDTGAWTAETLSRSDGDKINGHDCACTAFEKTLRDKSAHTAEYTVTNGRHLYNIRFVEDYADKITNDNMTKPGQLKNNPDWHDVYTRSFKLTESINWHDFCAYNYRDSEAGEDYFFDSYYMGNTGYQGIGVAGIRTETAEFPSFRQINAGDSLTATPGTAISNLTITTDANERYGIYGYNAYTNNIDSLKSNDTAAFDRQEFERAKGHHPTGLFVYNYGKISGLTLEKHKVFGSYKVGGFVGENYGELADLMLKNEANDKGSLDNAQEAFVSRLIALKLVIPYFYGTNQSTSGTYYNKIAYSEQTDGGILRAFVSEQLYKKNTSFIVGIQDVGGICGYQKYIVPGAGASARLTYTRLENYAYVCGQMYVGGIIGRIIKDAETTESTDKYVHTAYPLETDPLAIVFDTNKNRGRILALPIYDAGELTEADSTLADVRSAYYLGGICGMACDNSPSEAYDEDFANIKLSRCSSYWLYTDDEIDGLISGRAGDMEALSSELRGWYYGGLTGFARLVCFDNCTNITEAAEAGTAYIFGRNYVGGFTGLAQLCGFVTNDGKTTNGINVIGRTCAGGIAAVTGEPYGLSRAATADELAVYQTEPSNIGLQFPQYAEGAGVNTLSDLLNTGLVYAMGNDENDDTKPGYYGWAGGICGWNGEELENCDCMMSAYAKKQLLKIRDMAKGYDKYTAACAGGIAGFNSCMISGSSINAVVFAADMAGGVTGCNDVLLSDTDTAKRSVINCMLVDPGESADIPDEGVSGFAGSYICADGDYAGGICGLLIRGAVMNTDSNTITGSFIVHAQDYAGGLLGYARGTKASEQGIPIQYSGSIIAKEGGLQRVTADGFFAGGIAGAVTQQAGYYLNKQDGFTGSVSAVTEVSAGYFAGGFAGAAIIPQTKAPGADKQWMLDNEYYTVKNGSMSISAKAAAGGCCGYYQVCPSVWDGGIDALYNSAAGYAGDPAGMAANLDSIAAGLNIASIDYDVNTDWNQNGDEVNNLKIEYGTADIKAGTIQADYWAGGIFGFVPESLSMYFSCSVSNTVITNGTELMGEGYTYAGGITGRTGSRMMLDGCSNSGFTASQSAYYGGLCEVNRGTIQNCVVGYAWYSTDGVSGHDGPHEFVGGLCGRNEGTITGFFASSKDNGVYSNTFDVSGASYVGGLCGENVMQIRLADNFYYVISVDSQEYAGGVCGLNKGTILGDEEGAYTATRTNEVVLMGKYAGLVAGRNEDGITGITIDSNTMVSFTVREDGGAAGGIAGVNAGRIEGCVNKANIMTANGSAGAFAGAAEAGAVFYNLRNEGDISADVIAAGIAAVRSGDGDVSIDVCRNYGAVTTASGKYGITGVNGAKVSRSFDAGQYAASDGFYNSPSEASDNFYLSGRITETGHEENGVIVPADSFKRNQRSLTQLSDHYTDEGKHKLYAMAGGIAYTTKFNALDNDPLNYNTARIDELDENFLIFITGN